MSAPKMLNIGCGSHYHPDWINLDVAPADPNVMAVDINKGLPFPPESAGVCYSSHVLEHLNQADARCLIDECFRVLEQDGVIRLVLPDLEALVREYLRVLDALTSGDETREPDYDWLMLELYDQTIRTYSGGEMADFLRTVDERNKSFIRFRIGSEAEQFWLPCKDASNGIASLVKRISRTRLFKLAREKLAGWLVYLVAGKSAYQSFRIGLFRNGGEIHQWMYDRYSLERLLRQVGFVNVKVCAANESRIAGYGNYSLDVLNDVVRKPDSLYIEASKP